MENEVNTTKANGSGAVIGVVIIIILLIAGAWYFIGNKVDKIQTQNGTAKTLDVTTGTSTELPDIQKDLNNLDLKVLDQP
jgi:hypothetical protein